MKSQGKDKYKYSTTNINMSYSVTIIYSYDTQNILTDLTLRDIIKDAWIIELDAEACQMELPLSW